ncbi:MAG: hypothetical protein E6Q67_13180 [Roseateles sp.]|nr:MAG: hypothetical protein E6Q67_13180 [Roseateles sp.]
MKLLPLILLATSCLVGTTASAAPPAVNLQVEWRWVDSTLSAAALAGVRDGATVIGTAGSVSPHGALVTSSVPPAQPPVQRLTVLNGQSTRLQLDSTETLQWQPSSLDLDPGAPSATAAHRVRVKPQPAQPRQAQSISLTPTWAGGRAPVRVEFSLRQDGTELASTVLLPMERWQTVARTGTPAAAPERGVVSSRSAEGRPERELQLRIAVQP